MNIKIDYMEITEDDYYLALLDMLDHFDPCEPDNCPACILDKNPRIESSVTCTMGTELSDFCKSAVDLDPRGWCPCNALGREEALWRAKELLKNKGYC